MTKGKRIGIFILCLALLCIIGGELLLSLFSVKVSAEGVTHSNVIDDLQKDPEFKAEDFPDVPDDYSIQVIQIAEGENGELFVYAYQPSDKTKDYKASYINMSLDNPQGLVNPTYKLYGLTWLNSNGVFDKYQVNGFKVSTAEKRYYSIASIYRPFDGNVDTNPEAVDGTDHKGYGCGVTFVAQWYNDVLYYDKAKLNVVETEILASGSVRYFDGFKLGQLFEITGEMTDSHYVAFKIEDYNVEQIFDADISYSYRSVFHMEDVLKDELLTEYGQMTVVKNYFLSKNDINSEGSSAGGGLFGKKYKWNRILTSQEFITMAEDYANEPFSDVERAAIQSSQFVFCFLETPRSRIDYDYNLGFEETYTDVFNIGILRLHFITKDGKPYNLGCVSDLVKTDNIPDLVVDLGDNIKNTMEELWDRIGPILLLILLILIFVFLGGPISFVLKVIWDGVKFIFKLVLGIVKIPFKIIGWLLKPK